MKGLFIKELYMLWKYFKLHLVLTMVFSVGAILCNEWFYLFYLCIAAGGVPLMLQSYDERQHWDRYSRTMPYSTGQLVGVKYCSGLMMMGINMIALLMTGLIHGTPGMDMLSMILLSTATGMCCLAVMMPCTFRFGAEKARMVSPFAVGVVCSLFAITNFTPLKLIKDQPGVVLSVFAVAVVAVVVSWLLSIRFYRDAPVK